MSLNKLIVLAGFVPALVLAQSAPNMIGTWSGPSNAAVAGSDLFHPTVADKSKTVRFTKTELVLVIDREEGRNFTGYIGPKNTDIKKLILGSFTKDMKRGIWVSESGGSVTFELTGPKNLEFCYTQILPKPMVANCLEMVKQ